MILEIGKPYRLPNGEKGICVGFDGRYCFSYKTKGGCFMHYACSNASEVTPWTEPRTWEDEVRIYEDHGSDCIYRVFASSDVFEHDNRYKLVGRAKVVVQEGGE